MNSQDLRIWLQAAAGESVNFQGVQAANRQGLLPAQGDPPNGSYELYFPITINRLARPSGFGYELRVANSTMADRDGVYLPDYVNQCTRVNATANGIVISGKFTGCTFARCTAGGNEFTGHIYVSAATPDNDPVAQARSFEQACGAPANSAVGFPTVGHISAPAGHGYIIGTLVTGAWQWDWMTVQPDGTVVGCVTLAPANWVPL
jgi:hypothetical protein